MVLADFLDSVMQVCTMMAVLVQVCNLSHIHNYDHVFILYSFIDANMHLHALGI